jgi:hypothetical protein
MTPRQLRTQRRAAERAARKQERKAANGFVFSPHSESPLQSPEGSDGFIQAVTPAISQGQAAAPVLSTRAETNRANAQRSTGPRTPEGKVASSRNSLKHGLASAQLIIPGEDPAAFDTLLADLLDEHQPANPTEQLLVQEMAQSYWLTQRAIRFQNQCFAPEGVNEKRLALFLRYQTTHDRAFHKALNTLIRLKKDRTRGFVSQEPADSRHRPEFVSQKSACAEPDSPPPIGFVSQNDPASLAQAA